MESKALSLCLHCGTSVAQKSSRGAFCCKACELLYTLKPFTLAPPRPVLEKYQAYEKEELRRLFDQSQTAETSAYRLFVEGLECSSCVHLLENLPQYLPQVRSSRLHFTKSELYLETEHRASLAEILSFIHSLGYLSHPLRHQKDLEEKYQSQNRQQLRRIAVAGACAGNIMLFTVAIYAGVQGPLEKYFQYANFLLFLPVLFYSAQPLYRNAWVGFKNHQLNMDAPLALAFLASSIASIYNLFRGSSGVYFDSSAGFLFLILVSRWFLKNAQRRWIESPLSDLPWTREFLNVKAGDELLLKNNQSVPVDGVLLSGRAQFDSSWMTGESLPQTLQSGMKVLAGYRLLSDQASLRASTSVQDSELALTLQQIEQQPQQQSQRLNEFDRRAQALLVFVLIVAVLLFAWGRTYFHLSWNEAFERSLSLLIVACPCALAFGGPLAYAMGLRQAAARGILIKNPDVLDKVRECQNLVFDKTGTLTEGRLVLQNILSNPIPSWMKELILTLEKKSTHPVAHAFREAFVTDHFRELILHDIHEVPGEKIFGLFHGQIYSLEKSSRPATGIRVDLKRDDKVIAEFIFDDRLRTETRNLLFELSQKFRLMILSGDREDRVQALVQELNIPGLVGHGDQLPRDKSRQIKNLPLAMMIGDGINDIAALAEAHVGVAVHGSIQQGLQKSSVYFLNPGLTSLQDLLKISWSTHRLVKRNIHFALAYNLLAGAAAVGGFISPLMAAVLMPLSSLIILFSTWRAGR